MQRTAEVASQEIHCKWRFWCANQVSMEDFPSPWLIAGGKIDSLTMKNSVMTFRDQSSQTHQILQKSTQIGLPPVLIHFVKGCSMNYTIQPLGYLHVIISLLYYLPCVPWNVHSAGRRKFGSQTSDIMDRWKSSGGKSQRGEEKKW